MALLKTIAEIRAVIPRLSKLSDTANLPNVDKAGRMHIKPIIGKELYDDLNTKFNTGTPSANELLLIKNIQLPLAAFTLLDDLAFLHTTITDSGIRTSSTDTLQAAHRWEYLELKEALINYATDGIELLLQYLYENKDLWALWTASAAFKEIDNFLIKTGIDFSKQYPLFQPLRTFWSLKPVLEDVEENYLATQLGRDLLAFVKTQSEIIITGDGGQIDVIKLLKKATAHLSIKHACDQMAVRFDENGFTIMVAGGDKDNSSQGSRAPADGYDVCKKMEAANREGQNYLTKATKYLVGIANGVYDNSFGSDFNTAFDKSPLKIDPNAQPYTNGNSRRKIFRF